MKKNIFLFFIFLFILTNCEKVFPKENEVIILTDATFDLAIKQYKFLMVFFYAPWCIRCNKFHPEYEKAASILKSENLFLAKVDATVEKKLDKKFEITGFPVLKLFIKGKPIEYNGERNHEDLIKWIRKKTNGPAIEELNEELDIDIFIQGDDVVMIYYGKDENDIEECIKIARKNDDIPFGIVKNDELIKKFANNTKKIMIYKHFDENKQELNIIKEKDIEDFIIKYSTPKIMNMDKKTMNFIFEKKIPAIILYAHEHSRKWKKYKQLMLNISEKINYKLKVIITDIKEGLGAKNAEIMNVKEKELPTVRIADSRGEYLKKYKLEGELSESNILKFIDDWENKRLKSYIKSAEIPEDNNEDVLVVVGKTFEKEVINNDNDVMLLFYSPLCYHLYYDCKDIIKKYSDVAKILKRFNKKLILGKIDFSENEVESIHISGSPKFKFFPGKKKDKAPIDYEGDNSVDDIIKFIKEHASYHIILDENEEL